MSLSLLGYRFVQLNHKMAKKKKSVSSPSTRSKEAKEAKEVKDLKEAKSEVMDVPVQSPPSGKLRLDTYSYRSTSQG